MSAPTQGSNPAPGGEMPPAQGGAMPPTPPANGVMPSSDPANQGQPPNPRQGWTTEQYEDALRKAREEAIQHRKKLDEIEAARTSAERAKMDEASRAKAELEDAKKQLETIRAHARDNALEAAVALKARELGIVYPDLAKLAIASSVQFGDDDKPQNVDELLRAFVQTHPNLTSASAVSANTSIANAPRPQGQIVITREQRGDMAWVEAFKKQYGVKSLGEAITKGIARFE